VVVEKRKATRTDRVCWVSGLAEWIWCWDEASVGSFEGVVDTQRSVNEHRSFVE
jgi:hypothetical protein